MEIFNNTTKVVKDALLKTIKRGDRISMAEKTPKERREFYIPRLQREKSLYGTEFEVRLRNELKQKAVAKECADWMRRKVCFKPTQPVKA